MIEIGKTYLDTRGREHSILGYAKNSTGKILHDTVWSMSHHFHLETGKGIGAHLVDDYNMTKPAALAFWRKKLADYLENNALNDLRFVDKEIENIKNRINLIESTWK